MTKKDLLLIIPIAFFALYFCVGWLIDVKYIYYLKPFIIPTLMVFVAAKYNHLISWKFYLFAFLFYVGENLILFSVQNPFLIKYALIIYLFSYSAAISLVIGYIKHLNFRLIVQRYTIFIIIINCFFLILILILLESSISDVFISYIIVLNVIASSLLGIFAVLYLNEKPNKKAFFYFFAAFTMILSDIFGALCTYFYENTTMNFFERILHFVCFVFFILFVITSNSVLQFNNNKLD